MKKIAGFIMSVFLVMSLAACGGDVTVEKDNVDRNDEQRFETEELEELILDQTNEVPDYVDFRMVKVQTTKRIEGSMGGGIYYENDDQGQTYIDVVLDLTNTSTEEISSEDVIIAKAVGQQKEYGCSLYAVETNSNTYVSQYEAIPPLTTVRLHCAISVPEDLEEVDLLLNVNGMNYSYSYDLGKIDASVNTLNCGQTIEREDYAAVEFLGTEYTDDLLPPNTSGYYSHYQVDSADNTYLVAKFNVTNFQGTEKSIDSFVGVKAIFDGKYVYTGFAVVEESDGTGFDQYTDISPLTTRKLYTVIEVPKIVVEKEAQLSVVFDGDEYAYELPVQ